MGEFFDSNGIHQYAGDLDVCIEDMPYSDIARFLNTHGFRVTEVTPGTKVSAETYRHRDGRSVQVSKEDSGYGIPEISSISLKDGNGSETQPSAEPTIGDLTNFVNYGKLPDSPEKGGDEVTQSDKIPSQNAIKDEAGYKATTAEIAKAKREWISKPMGPYSSWASCKAAGKSDAYCGYLYHNASPEGHGKSLDNRTALFVFSRKFLVGPNSTGSSSTPSAGSGSQSSDGGQVRSEQPQIDASNPELGTGSQSGGAGGMSRMEQGREQVIPGVQNPHTGGLSHQEQGIPQQPPPQPKPGEAQPGAPSVPDNSKHHANMAYSLGNKPIIDAQRHLEGQGYQLTGTTAKIGEDLVHTYAHPEGHTVEISSSDGKNVSGIDYAIPKPPKPQKPQANVFASQAQPQAQPKQDMPAYPGGAASITGQGMAEEGGPGSGRHKTQPGQDWLTGHTGQKLTTVPSTSVPTTDLPGTSVPKFEEVTRSYNKGLILGPGEQMGGAGIFCGICHSATGRYVHYKGLQVCPGCAVRAYGISRRPMRK